MNWRFLFKGLAMLTLLAGVGFLLKITPMGSIFEQSTIDEIVKGQGARGHAIFIGAGVLLTAVGFSRQAVAFMAGYAFGFSFGVGISVLATTIGCSLTFFYARFFGYDAIVGRFPDKISQINCFISEHPFSMTLLIRFLPVGSNILTNLAAGVSSVSGPVFVIASAVGYIPQMVIFALLGSGVNLETWHNIFLSILLFILSGLIGIHLYRKYRRGRRLAEVLD